MKLNFSSVSIQTPGGIKVVWPASGTIEHDLPADYAPLGFREITHKGKLSVPISKKEFKQMRFAIGKARGKHRSYKSRKPA